MVRINTWVSALLCVSCGMAPVLASAAEFTVTGDVRVGLYGRERLDRDGSHKHRDEVRLRLRPGMKVKFNNQWEGKIRAAGRYTTHESNNFKVKLFEAITAGDGLRMGDTSLDELYLGYRPGQNWHLKLGRMQTKFELEGVGKKSLTRNDSPNTDISWTDGLYVRYRADNSWNYYGILQRSTNEGPTTVRRAPLNFEDDASHITYYFGAESKDKKGRFAQRGVDLTYIPQALLRDGRTGGRIEDYYALSGRLALRWPLGRSGTTLIWAGELGYAPNTSTKAAIKLPGEGDASGMAMQTTLNLVNFYPHHSIGLIYARAGGGWLLSPDFGNNQQLVEVRYKWQVAKNHRIEARLRQREDLIQRVETVRKRRGRDYYLRYTYKF